MLTRNGKVDRRSLLRIFLAVSTYPEPASHILPFAGKGSSSSLNLAATANTESSNSGVISCVGSGRGVEYDDAAEGDPTELRI
jgi:hypothetical protein